MVWNDAKTQSTFSASARGRKKILFGKRIYKAWNTKCMFWTQKPEPDLKFADPEEYLVMFYDIAIHYNIL